MHNNPYEVLNILSQKTNSGKCHLDCQKCGCLNCVIFAIYVSNGERKVSDCPFMNNESTDELTISPISKTALREIDILNSLDESNNKLIAQKKEMLTRLKKQIPNPTHILSVPIDGGLFDLFDHRVTGDELNNVIKVINSQSIEQNKTWINTYNHIADVIRLISDLDAEYLKKILVAFHAANLAISELKIANERIDGQQNDIKASQKDITDLVNGMNTTFLVLKKHKEKLDKIQHLEDIDAIFDNQSELSNKLLELNRLIELLEKKFSETSHTLNELSSQIDQAIEQNKKYAIDTTKKIDEVKKAQADINEKVISQQSEIETLISTVAEYEKMTIDIQKALDIINESFTQTLQKSAQDNAAIMQIIEKNDEDNLVKHKAIEEILKNNEQIVQDMKSHSTAKIEKITSDASEKYDVLQMVISELRGENANQARSLLIAKCVSAGSLLFSLVVVILFVTVY